MDYHLKVNESPLSPDARSLCDGTRERPQWDGRVDRQDDHDTLHVYNCRHSVLNPEFPHSRRPKRLCKLGEGGGRLQIYPPELPGGGAAIFTLMPSPPFITCIRRMPL